MKSFSAKILAVLLIFSAFSISGNAAERLDSLLYNSTTRPKVGLVLSGGGAKGSAHIGVLKVLEDMGIRPVLVDGSRLNLKITYPEDLVLARAIAGMKEG